MNKNKVLIPVAVLLITVISAYSLITTNIESINEYNRILAIARDYASQNIVDDAVKYYEKALEMNCNVDTYIEYMNVYLDNGYEKKALQIAEQMVEEIADSPKAYECLLDRYIESELYENCFQLNDEVTQKDLRSDRFAKKLSEVEFSFENNYQSYSTINVFSGGFAAVESEGLFGFVDEIGNQVLSKKYKMAGCFSYFSNNNQDDSNFVIPVCTTEDMWMYVSSNGNKKIKMNDKLQFDYLGMYVDNGLIAASSSGRFAYYDVKFKKQFGDYEYASTFNCGCAAIKTKDNEWYIINEKGKKLNSVPYTDVVLDSKEIAFRNNRAFVKIDGSYYMIDTSCNVIGNQKFIDAKPFLNIVQNDNKTDSNGVLAAVNIDGSWGFVDMNCKIIIKPQFQEAHSFSNQFAAVSKDGQWGFIESDGLIKIDYLFDDVSDFNTKGCVFVYNNSKWNLIKLYKYNH